jgi:BASS family bile acid:Na+ symporter
VCSSDLAWAQRIEPAAGRVATALFVLIVLATFVSQREALLTHLPSLGPACALLNAAVLALSWIASHLAGMSRRDAVAVATECGLQNSALGIYVTVELLRQPALSVPSVVYALLMNVGALAFVALMRRPVANAGGQPGGA